MNNEKEITADVERKNFRISIHGTAEYTKDDMDDVVDFDQLVKIYFKNNKYKLQEIFDSMGDIKVNSTLRNFSFDSVTKDVEA